MTHIFVFRQIFPEPDGVRIYPINSDEHSAGALCEERAHAAAGAGASRQARGGIIPTGNSGKQRGGERNGCKAVETNMAEASA